MTHGAPMACQGVSIRLGQPAGQVSLACLPLPASLNLHISDFGITHMAAERWEICRDFDQLEFADSPPWTLFNFPPLITDSRLLQISQPFFLIGNHGIKHLLDPPVLLNDWIGQERLEGNPPGLLQNRLGGQVMDGDLVEQ